MKQKFHSMRTELIFLIVGILSCALIAIFLVTTFGLEPLYRSDKIKELKAKYDEIDKMDSSADDFSDRIISSSSGGSLRVTVTDESLTPIASNIREIDDNWSSTRLFAFISGYDNSDTTELIETKTDDEGDFVWKIQESTDPHGDTRYLELWGHFSWGGWCLLQVPCQSISSVAHLTARFYIFFGLVVIVLAVLLTWFLIRRYTEPIIQLTDLSKKMAGLDFNARYTGNASNEIGELGASFNKMSDELEHTISELKTANAELQKDNERKTQIDEMRKEFLNNVSHELKTPIALIQGYAEGLKDNIAEDAESRDFYCDVIVDESAKMNTMVRKLLTLNQLEFGNDPVVMDRFDLTSLIRGVVEGMKIMIDDSGARVSFPVSGPVYVWGDEFKIEEVVTNYLSNAVHHAEGDKKIEITVTPEKSGLIRTTVFNTGTPIPEEDLGRVFEKFFKVDKARTREYGGSGLGLSIVKAIMDGHHQKCGVRNYENGVAFWFTLEGRAAD